MHDDDDDVQTCNRPHDGHLILVTMPGDDYGKNSAAIVGGHRARWAYRERVDLPLERCTTIVHDDDDVQTCIRPNDGYLILVTMPGHDYGKNGSSPSSVATALDWPTGSVSTSGPWS